MVSLSGGDHAANEAIAAEMTRLAPVYDFTHLSGLHLRHRDGTAVADHVVVDRYGVLVISTLACGSAVIRGSDSDARWTVRFDDGTISTVRNPLLGLREVEKAIRTIAADAHIAIESDYVKSAVVVESTTTCELDLGPFDRERVAAVTAVESLVRLRNDFAPNPGDVDSIMQTSLVTALRAATGHVPATVSAAPWAVDHEAAAMTESSTTGRSMTQAQRRVAASDAVVQAPRKRSTAMHTAWYVFSRAMPLLVVGLAYWWVLYGGGMEMVVARVDRMTVPEDEAYSVRAADATSHQVLDNIPGVVKHLREDAPPEVVAAIVKLDSPDIARASGGDVVYTWSYTDADGRERTYTVRTTIEGRILESRSD